MADQTFANAPERVRRRNLSLRGRGPQVTDFMIAPDAEVHQIVNAIAATVANAQAGLNWLRTRPSDLEEVRQALTSIASDGKRACELLVRLRDHMNDDALADAPYY